MKVYEGKDLRNVGVVGHGHSGKTQLTAGLLFTTGATNRLTRVDEGNTLTDFDEEEISRKLTISSALAFADWKKTKINFLDTPGFNIFINDTKAALAAADSAFVLIDAVPGVEVQTEKTWGFANDFSLPRAVVVNKLDRDNASFDSAVESIQTAFGRACVPLHLPIGKEREFRGVVDLVTMKAYTYTPDGDGKGKESAIPADLEAAAKAGHEALVEMVAENDDALLEEFFAEGTLPVDHIISGLRLAVKDGRIVPILCASAVRNIGNDQLLDFAVDYFPAPEGRCTVVGSHNGQEVRRKVADSEPPSIFVFKTMADAFSGRVSYFKVMSGVVKNDAMFTNARTGQHEKLAHIGCLLGKQIQPVTDLHAGDIGAVAKLKDTLTGDTLYDKSPIAYPRVEIPEPSIAFAIEAKSRADEDRVGQAMHKILEEDSLLRFDRDPQTKEFLLRGSGQQHLEIVVSRLKKRYHVEVLLKSPKIPYRETIRGKADVQGRHKKQTGGHGQFGDCWIRFEPLARGDGFVFASEIFGGSIPRNFIPAIEKGLLETAPNGFLAGYPLVDFKATVYDGSYHDVDSSELAFKLAARKAFRAAMQVAKPALLEPIMNIEVQAPVEFAGDLMGDLNGRRGRIAGMDTKGTTQFIKAQVPMSELLTYQNDLTSMTQGRGQFHMEFDHYDYVPALQADKIVAAHKAHRTGEEEEDE